MAIYPHKTMRFHRHLLLVSLIFLQDTSQVTGFTPACRKSLSPNLVSPRVNNANLWINSKNPVMSRRKSPTTALQASFASLAAGMKVLHSNPSYVLSAIFWLSTFGISLERRTIVGKALSAPLATMAIAMTTANLGLLPFESPVCKFFSR